MKGWQIRKYLTCKIALLLFPLFGCGTSETAKFASDQDKNSSPSVVEARSLLDTPLLRPGFSQERFNELENQRAEAEKSYLVNPDDPERIIWLGRRTAYLGRYREAIKIFSEGINKDPLYFKFYRHRGHRYISIREFDKAIEDLEKASKLIHNIPDETEADGMPNKYNIPTSTTHTNIWYHLGLAYYLKGDFPNAERCYLECLRFSKNDDMLCAATDWLYMTYRRQGKTTEAQAALEPIHENMIIYEDSAYFNRLLMYKGLRPPESLLDEKTTDEVKIATNGYGVGNWYFCEGNVKRAEEIFRKVIAGKNWAAFGFIAAEAEIKRLQTQK